MREHGPIELVIFDCDGVLVDSETLAIKVEREMLAELGVTLSADEINRRFTGKSDASMNAELRAQFGVELGADFAEDRRIRMRSAFEASLEPVAGIAAMLDHLVLPRCVASSSMPERIAHSLALTGLASHFGERVYSASMVARGKPAPDLFLFAAAQCGVVPERCVVVEDSPYGVEGAVAAGMTAIGFTAGRHCLPDAAARLSGAGAHELARSAPELATIIEAFAV